jgi:PAS domain-containing protein
MMAKNKRTNGPIPSKTLRQRAEEMACAARTNLGELKADDVQRLVHELQVHQIELELQNEELREAQIALAETRDRYSDLYEFAPVGYLSVGPDGVIREANVTAAKLLARERASLIGNPTYVGVNKAIRTSITPSLRTRRRWARRTAHRAGAPRPAVAAVFAKPPGRTGIG